MAFLIENLGNLGYRYKKNQMAVTFAGDADSKLEFIPYEVIESDQDSISIRNLQGDNGRYLF